jgi:hypothetical protein
MIAKIRVMTFILIAAGLLFAQDYENLGRNIVLDLLAHRYEKVASQFNSNWAQFMPAKKMAEFLDAILRGAGEFQTITGIRSEKRQGYSVVFVTCRFDKNTLDFNISFDSDDRIASLAISPGEPMFDQNADAKAAIKRAVDTAAADDIRVLVAWGTNDDKGSRLFLDSKRNPAISASAFFSHEYRTVNVDVGHMNKNIELAKSYDAKLKAGALPALTVLDSAGAVIANTNAEALRPDSDPSGIDPAKVDSFLKSHQAPAPNAVELFEAGLKQVKEQKKMVFVWFSAPW